MSIFSKPKKRVLLCVDISSSKVTVALVESIKGSKPHILDLHKIKIQSDGKESVAHQRLMLLALKKGLEWIFEDSIKRKGLDNDSNGIDACFVSLMTPWVTSRIVTSPFGSSEHAEEAYRSMREELGLSNKNELDVLDTSHIKAHIGGYAIPLEKARKLREAEATYLIDSADRSLTKSIEEEITKVFGLKNGIHFQSFNSIFAEVHEKMFAKNSSNAYLRMTDHKSDVFTKKEGLSHSLFSIPFGPAHLATDLGTRFNIHPEIAESYITLFTKEALESGLMQKINDILSESEIAWKRSWTEHRLNNNFSGINTIHVITEPKYHNFSKILLEGVMPEKQIHIISSEDDSLKRNITSSSLHLYDDPISFLSLYAHNL